MKHKFFKIKYLVPLCVMLVVGIAGVLFLNGNSLKASSLSRESEDSDDSRFQQVSGETVVIENENLTFCMDVASTHFTVTDKHTGTVWNSVAPVDEETGKGNSALSELMIDYYDENSMKNTMYSNDNSVAFESYEIRQTEDAVRVYYEIRKEKDDFFVPASISKEVFEEEVLGQLAIGPRKRLQKYYKLQDGDYVVSDEIGTNAYREITEYMEEAGYTQADDGASIDMPAKFLIPVEYSLNEDGFTARVLTNQITVANTGYTLTDVHLLPAFAGTGANAEGYLVVPDGSGGLISFQEEKDILYTQQIYGTDRAVNEQQSLQQTMQAVLPVYGMDRTDSGVFCVIEQGAECAMVQAQVSGSVNVLTGIYADFQIRTYDVTEIGAVSEKGSYNLYAKEGISIQPQVRYVLMNPGQCDYVAMANYYQQYLVEQGVFDGQTEEKKSLLYLDFTGYLTQESSMLGIPYDKKMVLSTLTDIEAFFEELEKENIANVSVRLKGYSHGGLEHGLTDSFRIVSDVGTKEQLQSLASTVKKQGGLLYLEDDLDSIYKNSLTDRFQRLTHGVRRIDRMVVSRGEYDIVLNDTKKQFNERFILSPKYYESMVKGFTDSLDKTLGSCSDYGYSWSGYGSRLTGDYNPSDVIDRTEARDYANQAIQNAKEFGSIMTEKGNLYSLQYADTLMNVPLSDSSFQSVTESIPFYQMVLHGYKTFTGAALNAVSDAQTEWLRSVESGAALYYSCMTEDYSLIKDMNYRQTLYPISTELCKEEIVSRYQSYEELYLKTAMQRIVKHEISDNGLRVTTYEDGTKVIVNYENETKMYGDIPVEAGNYAVQ